MPTRNATISNDEIGSANPARGNELVWSWKSLRAGLKDIFVYIAQDDPVAAESVVSQI
ncbi:MAG: hypothetical protein U5K38_00025 [Woeseiaceae bacterium]|nr:hypothetical protein [Woeseiaceae bacterium]